MFQTVTLHSAWSETSARTRETAHQEGVCPQAKLTRRWKPSSQSVLQQPVSGAGRTPEEQSHQRDDQAVVRASDGERDRVKSYMSEVCAGGEITRTRQRQRQELSSDIVSTMTVSDIDFNKCAGEQTTVEVNKIVAVLNNPLQLKIPVYTLN